MKYEVMKNGVTLTADVDAGDNTETPEAYVEAVVAKWGALSVARLIKAQLTADVCNKLRSFINNELDQDHADKIFVDGWCPRTTKISKSSQDKEVERLAELSPEDRKAELQKFKEKLEAMGA